MKKILIELIINYGFYILKTFAQSVWNGFWATLLDAVSDAEVKWKQEGKGEAKKEWVKAEVMRYIQSRIKMNRFKLWAVEKAVERAIDLFIKELNSSLGKSWSGKVSDLKRYIAETYKIPFID